MIFECLRDHATSLRELNLEFNSIGEMAGLKIADAMKNMQTPLEKLSLGSNDLKD